MKEADFVTWSAFLKNNITMNKLILLILVFVAFSCSPMENSQYEINPENFKDNKISLSKISDNIVYIPLDNRIPVGTTHTLRVNNNHIYLSVKDIGILQYDRKGVFLKQIGRIGRGPNEYVYGMNFTIDNNDNVYVADYQKIKVYSPSGQYLRDISYSEYINGSGIARDIEFYNSMLFVPLYIENGKSKYSWFFIDTMGNLVNAKKNSVPLFETNFGINGSVYKFEDRLYYYNCYNDTVFSISPDLNYRCEYLFSRGNHRWPMAKINFVSESQFISEVYELFQPANMFETKHYIVFFYGYFDTSAIVFIEKKSKRTYLAYRPDGTPGAYRKSKPWLINDVDAGLPLSSGINYLFLNGIEYITALINPLSLKNHVSSDEFKSSTPKFSEKKKDLEKLANILKETDNPVLMLVSLKK